MDAILRAVKRGDLDEVRRHIEAGASVNSCDCRGQTLLHWAAKEGLFAVAELLISNNCDLDPKDCHGCTPMLQAALEGNKNIVHLLLQHGAQVNCYDNDNYTLLHSAARHKWADIALLIIQNGESDLNAATTRKGCTPLMIAVKGRPADVAALLIRGGADVHRTDADGWTALHSAVCSGQSELVKLLIEKVGRNLNPQDELGRTPLHIACFGIFQEEVVKPLLVAGADPNIRNKDGETCLSVYLKFRNIHLEAIKLLVQYGAFFEDHRDAKIIEMDFLRVNVLKDVDLCTQSVVNKFNHQTLRALYSHPALVRMLPTIENFELNVQQMDEVKNFVSRDIDQNLFCNVVRVCPTALSALCIQSLVAYIASQE